MFSILQCQQTRNIVLIPSCIICHPEGLEMTETKSYVIVCKTLAEKCKEALERSYGSEVPMPRELSPKVNRPKQNKVTLKKEVNVQADRAESTHKFIKVLSHRKKSSKLAHKTLRKIEKQKRLSTDEFQRLYSAIWKTGPATRYRNPDQWLEKSPNASE